MLNELVERRVDPRPLALMRIVVGIASLMIALEATGVLLSAAEPGTVTMPAFAWAPDVTSNFAAVLFLLWSLAGVLLAIGYGARASAALVAGCGIAALVVEQQAYSNHLMLLIAVCLLMALANPGAVWSVAARRGRRQTDVPFWPIALLMLQISTMYVFAALSKLNGSFLAGETMIDHSRLSLSDLPPGLLSAMAASAICTELFLAVALWSPRLRPAAFSLGLLLHGGIVLLLAPAWELVAFAMLALSGYVLFLQPTHRTVVWDGTSSSTRRWVGLLQRLDWLDAHEFVEREGVAFHVLANGVRYEGYEAVGIALEACPATFLVAPLLRIRLPHGFRPGYPLTRTGGR